MCICTDVCSSDLCARMHHVHGKCVACHACVCMWSGPVLLFAAAPHCAVRVRLAYGAVWGACRGGCPEQFSPKLWAPLLLRWGACVANYCVCCIFLCSIQYFFFEVKLGLVFNFDFGLTYFYFGIPLPILLLGIILGAPSSSVGHPRLYGGIFIFVIMRCVLWARGASL